MIGYLEGKLLQREADRILLLITAGEVVWNNEARDFDWSKTTAIPRVLGGHFAHEPLYVDFRWASASEEPLTLTNPRFRTAALAVAAPRQQR